MINKKANFWIKNILGFIGLFAGMFSSNYFYENSRLDRWLKNALFETCLIILIVSALFIVINAVIYFSEEDGK